MSEKSLNTSQDLQRLDIDPFCEACLSDPFSYYQSLRDAGPVFWLDAIGAYGVARFDEATHVLKNHDVFVSGRGVGLADFAKEELFRPPSLLLEADALLLAMRDKISRITADGAPVIRLNNTLCSLASLPVKIVRKGN